MKSNTVGLPIIKLALVLCGLAGVSAASAGLLLEEGFSYSVANLAGQGGWSGGSGSQVTAGSLNLAGLAEPIVTSNKVSLPVTASTALKPVNATPISGGDVYLSFILKQTTLAASTTGATLAGLDDDGTVTTSNGRVAAALGIHVRQTNGTSYLIGIRKGQGASGAGGGADVFYTGSAFAVGDMVFVVARYSFGGGAGDDTVTLWVNPPTNSFGGIEPAASIAATNTGNSTDAGQVQYAFVRCNSSTTSGVNELDDLRVGTTWADVTPPAGGTTPPSVPSAQPRITQAQVTGNQLILRGDNGVTNGVYQVVSAPESTLPLAGWVSLTTNLFDGNGNFATTNPIAPGDSRRFYRLLVGGSLPPSPVDPPVFLSQPTNVTVLAGQDAVFTAAAGGSAPLAFQWFFNPNTPLAGATAPTLVISNAQAADLGGYSLRVTNSAGAVTSVVATLTVLLPPVITQPPQSQVVGLSNAVNFSVNVTGTAPLHYQWYFNSTTVLPDATNAAFAISAVTSNDAGGYSVVVTNLYGAVTSSVATLTVSAPGPNSADFNLYGFGAAATGGGLLAESDPNYRKVYTPGDLRLALANNNTKVIEIMNDLNLGWNEIGASNQTGAFRQSTAPSLHPVLLASGITTVDIQNKNGLTIFSASGATIRHGEFNVKRTHNLLIRNLKFDELWEWDEATKGDYDSKDWDFITIGDSGNCTNVWIDHCDFTKSYDGVVDLKGGENTVTISWCRFLGDDGGPDSFVRRQFTYLETNGVAEAMFDFLRNNGFSLEDLVTIARSQKKGHLAGATEFSAANADLKLTLHHNYYLNFQDRMPRLRAGNSHVYNVYAHNTAALAAKNLRNARVAAIPDGLGSYKFDVTLNGAISTEDGAVLVEKCHLIDTLNPLRNNQTDPNDPAYTGKIRAEDTIYTLNGATFRGDTEDPGSPLVPVPAPVKPFSWNGFASLPYAYPAQDPSAVAETVTNYAGAGVVVWAKTNWFRTSY